MSAPGPASCCSASRAPARARRPRASPSTTASSTCRPATCSAPRRRRAPRSASRPSATWTAASSSPTRSSSAWSRSTSRRAGRSSDGFVLDGFPRTLRAGRGARPGARRPTRSTSSLDLEVPTEIVLDRIAGRRVCEDCGADVPRRTCRRRSTGPATCAAATSCSATTTPRRRSTRRLELYESETVPIIDYYRQLGQLVVVDGVGEGDEVFERLVKAIDERFDRRRRVITRKTADADRADAARRARSSPRCTRCASAPPSRARPPLDVDRAAREVHRPARRPLELPRLPRVPGGGVHVAQRRDRARHPERHVVLEDGDILSIDCGAIIEGWHADAAVTVPVGEIDDESQRLIEVTRALARGRDRRRWSTGNRLGDVGAAVEGIAEAAGFTVVREYVGHGIGTAMHEEPAGARTTGPPGRGMKLKEGIVLAIEPMVNAGERPRPRSSTTAGPSSPPTAAAPPTSSTPSPSPTTAPRSSPSRDALGAGIVGLAPAGCSGSLVRSAPVPVRRAWLAPLQPARGGDALWPSPRTTRSWSKERSSSRCPTPCSVSSSRTGTRCSPTSPGRCGCTTSGSSRRPGAGRAHAVRPQPRPHHLPLQVAREKRTR